MPPVQSSRYANKDGMQELYPKVLAGFYSEEYIKAFTRQGIRNGFECIEEPMIVL
jgi:hypothetical protein